ncbi:MAG TPA: hypothetical protein VFJ57_13445 [Solirubrobacterales bacterium]|nr:hypothetical protein [Solirubrobacterales bacterium]
MGGTAGQAGLALAALAPATPPAVELGVLFLANAAATARRYLLLRIWVFGPASCKDGRRARLVPAPRAAPEGLPPRR